MSAKVEQIDLKSASPRREPGEHPVSGARMVPVASYGINVPGSDESALGIFPRMSEPFKIWTNSRAFL